MRHAFLTKQKHSAIIKQACKLLAKNKRLILNGQQWKKMLFVAVDVVTVQHQPAGANYAN